MPSIAGRERSNGGGQLVLYGPRPRGEEEVAVYRVKHGVEGRVRPSICWGNGNQLRVAYLPERGDAGGMDQGGAVVELNLSRAGLGPESGPEKRRIAHGSLPAFSLLQSHRQLQSEWEGPYRGMTLSWWEHVFEYSRSISKVLGPDQVPSLNQPSKPAKDSAETAVVKAVWDLAEIFFVDKGAATWHSERLADWLRSYDHVCSNFEASLHRKLVILQQRLPSLQFPEEDEGYWNGIASALAVGWLDIVVKLLREHGSYQHDQIDDRKQENGLVETVAVLVSQMPRLRPSVPDGAPGVAFIFKPEFSKAWEKWRGHIAMLDSIAIWGECDNRATIKGLKTLLQILLGNVEVLAASTSYWMELLVAHGLHVRASSMALEGLLNVASRCIQYKPPPEDDPLQELILAIIGDDTEVVLAECAHLFDPWMSAHIVELLIAHKTHAQEVLRQERDALGGISLEENYRLHYAQVLSSHPLTWQLAPVYLASCPRQGLGTLKVLLLKQPVYKHHRLALKALDICRLYELDEVGTAICRMVGVHNWKHGRKGAGITWLQRAHDDLRLSAIADQLLQSFAQIQATGSNALEQLEGLVDLLGSEVHSVGGFQFLHRYRDLKKALQYIRESRPKDVEHQKVATVARQAAECLLQLLKPGVTPQRFWTSLLQDSVELLEWPDHVLVSAAETFTLLNCIQALALAKMRGDLDVAHGDQLSLDRVKLALASNLGRAFLHE